jgi:hypothetical protein
MSNPLIKPNDPRFQKPSLVDPAGQNRFAEGAAADGAKEGTGDAFAAGAAADARPYQPQYEVTQQARGGMLLIIAWLGIGGAVIGLIDLTGLFAAGYFAPLISVVPAATAWLLAYQDLRTMQLGAMDGAGRPKTRLAYWLGLFGLIACLAIVATAIWIGRNLLPDLL